MVRFGWYDDDSAPFDAERTPEDTLIDVRLELVADGYPSAKGCSPVDPDGAVLIAEAANAAAKETGRYGLAETRTWLKGAGFRWNRTRQVWQHACGIKRHADRRGDPRWTYGMQRLAATTPAGDGETND